MDSTHIGARVICAIMQILYHHIGYNRAMFGGKYLIPEKIS